MQGMQGMQDLQNCNKITGTVFYLQFLTEPEKVVEESVEALAEMVRAKIEVEGDLFGGFIISMREDMKAGKNKFLSHFPTWYALDKAEAQYWLRKVLPVIKYKLAQNSLADALTDEQIDEIYKYKEQKMIMRELKYGVFAY